MIENLNANNDPSRFKTPDDARNFVTKLIRADEARSKIRARVKGLVDGNPPFKATELQKEGQGFRANVNFREAESYLSLALSSFYDILSEASTYATVSTEYGGEDKSLEFSRIITEEFDKLQKCDTDFDYTMQLSQHEMVLFGTGPVFWDDPMDWKNVPIKHAALLLPDGTKSNINSWEVCVIRTEYTCSKLYDFIENENAASSAGWRIPEVKLAIQNADPSTLQTNDRRGWEFYQQQIRNNDLGYDSRSNTVRAAHILYREKGSRSISHIIINETDPKDYMFFKKARFKRWQEAINPLYYDKGDGQHHSVKGMGIKMYGVMEIKNRLKCGLVDSAFFRQMVLIQPQTVEAMQSMSVLPRGPYGVIPPNSQVVQTQISGALDAPMAIDRDMDNLIAGNLSQYRQRIEKPGGNPRTATEIDAIMAQQSTLGKTQLNRYYEQLDEVFAERFRRATLDVTAVSDSQMEAKEFMDACRKRGVPKKAFEKCVVRATRVVGQGSQYLRSQTLADLIQMAGMLPEAGRLNLIKDYFAAKVGQAMVRRYIPDGAMSAKEQDQAAMAQMEHAAIKEGIPPVVTSTQDHFIHAHVHIQFAGDSVHALQQDQGAIHDIAAFVAGICQHTEEHIKIMASDPTQAQKAKDLEGQLKQLETIAQQLLQQAQAQDQEAQKVQQAQTMEQMKMQAFQADQQRKNMSVKADIQRKDKKAEQTMALSDAKTANAISRAGVTHRQQTFQKAMTFQQEQAQVEADNQHSIAQSELPPAGT
jgi:hypothetical protein